MPSAKTICTLVGATLGLRVFQHLWLFLRLSALHEKCPYSGFFWSAFSRIRTRKTPNTDTFHAVENFLIYLTKYFWLILHLPNSNFQWFLGKSNVNKIVSLVPLLEVIGVNTRQNFSFRKTGADTRGVLLKKVFSKILQNLQGNTCDRDSFLKKLQAEACNFIKKETLAQMFSYQFCEIFKNTSAWLLLKRHVKNSF